MKKVLALLMIFTFIVGGVNAQTQKKEKLPKTQTVFIQSNTNCGDCKKRIENELNYTRGVIYAEVHLDKQQIEVKYRTNSTSIEKIRQKISEIGYAADDVAPNPASQKKLPLCCQPGGHD